MSCSLEPRVSVREDSDSDVGIVCAAGKGVKIRTALAGE